MAQSHELQELFSAILRISEIETLQVRRRFELLSLDALVLDVIESYLPDAEISGHILVHDVAEAIRIEGDRRLLHQLLSNAFDNALRHTPSGTRICVGLAQRQGRVTLAIQDDGPGVSQDEIPHLLKRFHRSEKSRHVAGNGLGLALVSAISTAHWAQVYITSSQGFRLEVVFPSGASDRVRIAAYVGRASQHQRGLSRSARRARRNRSCCPRRHRVRGCQTHYPHDSRGSLSSEAPRELLVAINKQSAE
ncbi:sensor histidine kinase [Xanthomonas axonopodis]|uniref:histidine kinase n=1 Tax=Xanthomonas axonopodis pv. cajani TaxID=487827 RepID=A0ABX3MEY7_9XANT|nr:sensor histidine kinase [Xanthomonas axonopodis]OOX12961.1 hypothetical protein Xcaj_09255 [Xanthomonas axonopodis pv. cajani]